MARFINKKTTKLDIPTRSDFYQYLICEVICGDDVLSSFDSEESMAKRLSAGLSYNENLLELQDKLYEIFWREAEQISTSRQWRVLTLLCEGFTQQEIAKQLKCNQSSITKTIHGSVLYKANNVKYYYGGFIKKFQKLIKQNEQIQSVLKEINEIV